MISQQGQMRPSVPPKRTFGELLERYCDSLIPATSGDMSREFTGLAVGTSDLAPGDLFVAYRGLRTHGANYLAQAIDAGAVGVLTDDEGAGIIASMPHADALPVIAFRDAATQRALVGDIAAWFYDNPSRKLTTIGVTGTNGKTTTTYFIDAALASRHQVTALLGTVQLRIGDFSIPSPRTTVEAPVLQSVTAMALEKGATALTTEVSSHALALQRVAGTSFDVAVFTNLQRDHLDFHHTMEQYFADKARLFSPMLARCGVICVDDEWGVKLAAEVSIPVDQVATYEDSAGYDQAQWRVRDAKIGLDNIGSTFTLVGPDDVQVTVHSPLPGRVNVSNAAVAVVAAYRAGVPLEDAAQGIERITAIPGRMERVVDQPDQPLVIVDYAHTPDALVLALQAVRAITRGKLIIVFGSDGDRDQGKRPQMGKIAAELADVLVVTDENPRSEQPESIRSAILAGVRDLRHDLEQVYEVAPRSQAVAYAIELAHMGDTVIITGKGHEPTQEIAGVFYPYNDADQVRAIFGNA